MNTSLQYTVFAGMLMLPLAAQANEKAMSYNCSLTPDSCVSVNYEFMADSLSAVQPELDKRYAKIDAIAKETKAGQLMLQNQNYYVNKDPQNNMWHVHGYMYYALRDKASADAFKLGLEAHGYSFDVDEAAGC